MVDKRKIIYLILGVVLLGGLCCYLLKNPKMSVYEPNKLISSDSQTTIEDIDDSRDLSLPSKDEYTPSEEVVANISGDALPFDVEVKVSEAKEDNNEIKNIFEGQENVKNVEKILFAYDISLFSNNEEIEPDSPVEVYLDNLKIDDTENFRIIHIKDNKEVEVITPIETTNTSVRFITSSFSTILGATAGTITPDCYLRETSGTWTCGSYFGIFFNSNVAGTIEVQNNGTQYVSMINGQNMNVVANTEKTIIFRGSASTNTSFNILIHFTPTSSNYSDVTLTYTVTKVIKKTPTYTISPTSAVAEVGKTSSFTFESDVPGTLTIYPNGQDYVSPVRVD